VKPFLDRAGMLLVLAALLAGCALWVPNFASAVNAESLLLSVSTVGLVACAMLFCLASGNFDLSVGSTVAASGVVAAVVLRDTHSIALAVAAALSSGALVGLFNGLIVARGRIDPLITTLATMQIVRGGAYLATDGKTVGIAHEPFFALGSARWLGLPLPVWLCAACMLLFGLLLARTTFGRATLAVGGNADAARLAGLPVVRTQVLVFVLQGLMCAVAGLVLAARLTSGQPMSAQGLELEVISACVLGGVSLQGGIGTMGAVVAGVLIMGTVQNAMTLLNVDTFWQYIARGSILLAAVLFDRWRR